MGRRFHIITMGCQMNEYDSDLASQHLLTIGYLPTSDPSKADLILINTCAVRDRAEQKAFSMLGRMIKQKKRSPNLKIGIMGCVAQQWGSHLFARFPELDYILGTRELARISEHLQDSEPCEKRVAATQLDLRPPKAANLTGYFQGRVTGFISIMEGCNNFCTYCIVPATRGREVSRSPEDIMEEARHLVSDGVKEITLLGQNVNSYSYGTAREYNFPLLLRALGHLPGLLRLRFTTSHPKDLSAELIQCFNEIPILCRHIHLPFQSGSNKILKRMNRRYTREHYLELIALLRKAAPGIAITSDVMVGFPGESEADFGQTLDLIQKIEFDNLYSFKYSDRSGTPASAMAGKVDEEEKTKRLGLLQRIQREITIRKNREFVGTETGVLAEGVSKRGEQITGRTEGNRVVNFTCDSGTIGTIVKVNIKSSSANSLKGICTVTAEVHS